MKTLKYITGILFSVILSTLSFSCSVEDDDPSGGSSTLTINNQKIGKIYNAQCIDRSYSEMLGGDQTTIFETQFEYDEELTILSIEWDLKRSELRNGMDLMDNNEYPDVTFRGVMSIEIGAEYEDFDGKVIVQSISDTSVTLKYSNFSFYKSLGRKTYTINGTMTYNLN